MRSVTIEQFHELLRAQGVKESIHLAFRCPRCKTIQSGADLIAAGAGATFEEIEKYLAFSCVGRFTGAGSPRHEPDGKPCNWSLGGLFQLHEFEVIDDDGKRHPRFEPVTAEEAQAHMVARAGGAALAEQGEKV